MTIAPEQPRPLTDLPKPRPGWMESGACSAKTPTRQTCGTCPVRWDCLLDAVHTDDWDTYRAAMQPWQRNAWLKEEGYTRPHATAKTPTNRPGQRAVIDMDIVNKRRAAGVKWDAIAPLFGCTPETVARHWRRAQQPPQQRRTPDFRPRKPLDMTAVQRMLAEAASFEAIGRELGVHPSTVVRQWRQSQAGAS